VLIDVQQRIAASSSVGCQKDACVREDQRATFRVLWAQRSKGYDWQVCIFGESGTSKTPWYTAASIAVGNLKMFGIISDPCAQNACGKASVLTCSMKTVGLTIYKIFNGGFCAKFTSKNTSVKPCTNFVVEVNMNPGVWRLQKQTVAYRLIIKNDKAGVHPKVSTEWI
jgi:hypothetical protein